MSAIIQVENVSKTYRIGKVDVPAVRGVSFDVERGEFLSVVYILGGLAQADSGRVLIDGTDFAQTTDSERTQLRRKKIGFVFQKFNLLPTLTARDNIQIAIDIAGDAAKSDPEHFRNITQLLGIDKRLDHRPSELSGGEQQRVALARALINKPAIVLADEPTGNLDTQNSDAVLEMLQRSNQELGQTVLMITHNPEAARFGNRILHFRDGQVVGTEMNTPRSGVMQ
jgi:putative ABC transport system ATP-binding protein